MTEEIVKVGIIEGVEGLCVAINDVRVAGRKPWGGGKVIKEWQIPKKDIEVAFERLKP